MFSRRLKGGGALTYLTPTGLGVGICSRVPVARRVACFADDLAFFIAHPLFADAGARRSPSSAPPKHSQSGGRDLPASPSKVGTTCSKQIVDEWRVPNLSIGLSIGPITSARVRGVALDN